MLYKKVNLCFLSEGREVRISWKIKEISFMCQLQFIGSGLSGVICLLRKKSSEIDY